MKETFILRTEWFDAINELSAQNKAVILDNLFHFHLGNESKISLDDFTVKIVWKLIEPNLKRNISEYDKRRETSAINGAKGGRPTNKNRNLNNLKKPNSKPKKNQKPNESLSDIVLAIVPDSVIGNDKKINIEFDVFWNLYDHKVGSKEKSKAKWQKLKDSEREKIIDTLPHFLKKITDKQFQPHPLTYLNNERWNDEIEIEKPKSVVPKGFEHLSPEALKLIMG